MIVKTGLKSFLAALLFICFLIISWKWFDWADFLRHLGTLAQEPQWLAFMFGTYLLSFMLKAQAWRMYAGSQERFRIYFHGIIYSLLVNHLLPVKAGDIIRTGFLMKNARKTWDEALHSVAIMRLMDMLVLGVISLIGVLWIGLSASWAWILILIMGFIVSVVAIKLTPLHRIPFVQRHWAHFKSTMFSGKGLFVMVCITVSWMLEAAVIYGIARMMELNLGAVSLIWANSVTIAGQVFHITPGGIGTYESTLSASLVVLGIGWKEAYAAALLSHTFKFAFAYVMGGYSLLRMPIGWREMKAWIINKQKSAKERIPS
ncbi:lysylphosphatidylglycerol synthase transmembrane domain-containing protein [Cohnella sp.]|uniref:lysylphosphatidylglycerol synthase transmembrane domain-containing protein n=1 Tax=Cohnella sp. TaxID=1883426 RepID=UPI003568807B